MSSAGSFLEKLIAQREKKWNSFFTRWESYNPDNEHDETFGIHDDKDLIKEGPHTQDAGRIIASNKVKSRKVLGGTSEKKKLASGVSVSKLPPTLICHQCGVDTMLPESWRLRKISLVVLNDNLCIDCMTKQSGHEECDIDECSICIAIALEDKTREDYLEAQKSEPQNSIFSRPQVTTSAKSIQFKRITLPEPIKVTVQNDSLKQIQSNSSVDQIDAEFLRLITNSPSEKPSKKDPLSLERQNSKSDFDVRSKEAKKSLSKTSASSLSTPKLKKKMVRVNYLSAQPDGLGNDEDLSDDGVFFNSYCEKENHNRFSNPGTSLSKDSTYLKVMTPKKGRNSSRCGFESNSSPGGSTRKRFVIARRQI